jgi:DNA-binding transcriptional MerR regulator
MSARNIRAHQSRGLLPPPTLRGRTGYYNEDHIARVELIQELQKDGYSLDLIQRLLKAGGGSTAEVRRFTQALHRPFNDERPGVIAAEELQRRFKSLDPEPLERAQELGLLRDLGDGQFQELAPAVLRGGEVFAEVGVSVEEGLEVAAEVRQHTEAIATTFLRLFVDKIWRPFEEAGLPEERLAEMRDAVERLRPIASDAVVTLFQLAMSEAAERRLGEELDRIDPSRLAAGSAGR